MSETFRAEWDEDIGLRTYIGEKWQDHWWVEVYGPQLTEQINRGALLMDLTPEQIKSINWDKVPALVEACKSIRDRLINSGLPVGDELRRAMEELESVSRD